MRSAISKDYAKTPLEVSSVVFRIRESIASDFGAYLGAVASARS